MEVNVEIQNFLSGQHTFSDWNQHGNCARCRDEAFVRLNGLSQASGEDFLMRDVIRIGKAASFWMHPSTRSPLAFCEFPTIPRNGSQPSQNGGMKVYGPAATCLEAEPEYASDRFGIDLIPI